MAEKNTIINNIIEKELKMFLEVNAMEGASCQENPDAFKKARYAYLYAWSEESLESYNNDLIKAEEENHNLLTEKYARMDALIPQTNKSEYIPKIIAFEVACQKEMYKKHPYVMSGGRPIDSSKDSFLVTSFETYLGSELETYSEKTLKLRHEDNENMQKNKINMTEVVYTQMVKQGGFKSLEEADKIMKERAEKR